MIYYIKFYKVADGIACYDSSCEHYWTHHHPKSRVTESSEIIKAGLRSTAAKFMSALLPFESVISVTEIQQSIHCTKEIVVWVLRKEELNETNPSNPSTESDSLS